MTPELPAGGVPQLSPALTYGGYGFTNKQDGEAKIGTKRFWLSLWSVWCWNSWHSLVLLMSCSVILCRHILIAWSQTSRTGMESGGREECLARRAGTLISLAFWEGMCLALWREEGSMKSDLQMWPGLPVMHSPALSELSLMPFGYVFFFSWLRLKRLISCV